MTVSTGFTRNKNSKRALGVKKQTSMLKEGYEWNTFTDNDYQKHELGDVVGAKKVVKEYFDPSTELKSLKETTITDLMHIGLAEVYYEALPLDEDYKTENSKRLKSKAFEFLNAMRESGVASYETSTNTLVEDMWTHAEQYATVFNLLEEKGNYDKAGEVYRDYIMLVKQESIEAANIIDRKVNEAVFLELKNDEKRQKLLERMPIVDGDTTGFYAKKYRKEESIKTLFEAINRTIINRYIHETTTDPDMDAVFGESIEYYTMLETLHTLKFFTIDAMELHENLRNMRIMFEDYNIFK